MTLIEKRICQGFSSWTGKPCGAQAVKENTVKPGTREFLDPRYCQMHQPGRVSAKKCTCPKCNYHRLRDHYHRKYDFNENEIEQQKFGNKTTKKTTKK